MKTLLGLLHFSIAAWAIYSIYQSNAPTGAKVLWSLAVFFFPIVGLLAWFFVGPK
ncbi:PLD nuclease N-terminal domain-containing protein [Thiofilum flexile]|uniref:PLD nuclease N-terminal domain-containing protein n=1 Tax=Thiofilum flexile TaxID=125627 RepID=UPI000374198E|nr:PLD nuclease N-terminal domain-containing protein [Thiofilum flexile]